MREITEEKSGSPGVEGPGEVLEEILKRGAQVLLQKAIENEVEEFVERYRDEKASDGLRWLYVTGTCPREGF